MSISFLHWNSAVTGFTHDETREYNRTFKVPESVARRIEMSDANTVEQVESSGEHAAELLILALRLRLDTQCVKVDERGEN